MADAVCAECGSPVLPTGVCSACGRNAHIDLEIAAFMTPHINRARIMLVLLGVLYAVLGYLAFKDLGELQATLDRWSRGGGGQDPALEKARSAVTIAYVIVGYVMVAGVANIALAAIAGKKTMLAFNVALGLFVIHTALQVYATEGAIFTSMLWWATAIILGMGYQAARKAEKLRRGG